MAASDLPPLYARWVAAWLGGDIPAETRATCTTCAMAPRPGAPVGPGQFDPTTKCCTYLPKLPNFRVGAVLADEDPGAAEGRATVEGRLLSGVGATPLGLTRPPAWEVLYRHGVTPSDTAFGRTRSLRCPHFLPDGRCGVWRHREGVCATWYCKHTRGAVGSTFWDTLGALLGVVEKALALDNVLALGIGEEALRGVVDGAEVADGLDGRLPEAARRRAWGEWFGRERELYVACAGRVDAMGADEVRHVAGVEGEAHLRRVRDAYAALVWDTVPERLRLVRLGPIDIGREAATVVTHRAYDPVEIPTALLPHLPRFDGRPTEVVHAELTARGAPLDGALLRRLVDWGVLVGVD